MKVVPFLMMTVLVPPVSATEAVDKLLAEYRQLGATEFSAAAGQALFFKEFKDEVSGELRQCTHCHTDKLTQAGQHAKSGKRIQPLAPSVNPNSLTEVSKIQKWLKRNCQWTLGRLCTPQEQGHLLTFIQQQ